MTKQQPGKPYPGRGLNLNSPLRDEIIQHLKEHHSLTLNELTKLCHSTKLAILYELERLEREKDSRARIINNGKKIWLANTNR